MLKITQSARSVEFYTLFFENVPYLLNFVPLLRKSSVDKSGRSLLDLCKVTINDSEIDKVCRYNMCMYCVDTLWKCFLLTCIWYFKRKISCYCCWPGWRPADCVHRQESSGVQRGPEPARGARQGRRPHQGQGRARPRPRRLAVRRGSERNFRMLPFTSAK